MSIWRKLLSESSLSRVQSHMSKYETAIITSHRGNLEDASRCTEEAVQQDGESNKTRNRDLKAVLLAQGYGVTKAKGSYIEDFETPAAMEVSEDSFFVVNLKNDPSFVDTITTLGEKYCQDSVLIIPVNG